MYLHNMALPLRSQGMDHFSSFAGCMGWNFKCYALRSIHLLSVWLFKVVSIFIVHGKIIHRIRDTEPREIEATDNKIEVRIKDTSYTMRLDLATFASINRNRRTLKWRTAQNGSTREIVPRRTKIEDYTSNTNVQNLYVKATLQG